jgi:hypothetical protein
MTKPQVEARVVIAKNGPYLVTGSVPLNQQTIIAGEGGDSEAWKEGDAFRCRPAMPWPVRAVQQSPLRWHAYQDPLRWHRDG